MVTVTQASDGSLMLKSHYIYGERIKHLPGAYWNPSLKVWHIPVSSMDAFESAFAGEYYYKTPRWVIRNEPMPDMSSYYKVPDIALYPFTAPFKLYDYQKYGAKFACDRIAKYGFAIISDGCGLGKTPQGIQVMLNMYHNAVIRNFIIICKKSVKTQWRDEIRKFAPAFAEPYPIHVVEGTAAKRRKIYRQIQKTGGITIVNYQTFLNDENELAAINKGFCIIDEAHIVSTYGTKTNFAMARCLKNIPTLYLTGTPILSNPEQIYGIISINKSGYFAMNHTQFKNRYIVSAMSGRRQYMVGVKNLDELRNKVQNTVIRRTEYEVSVELPSTIEKNVICPMDDVQKKLTEALKQKQDELEGAAADMNQKVSQAYKNGNMAQAQKLAQTLEALESCTKALIAARQACADDPCMFHFTNSKFLKTNFEKFVPNSYKSSSKVETALDIIGDILDSGEKVIIFSKFVTSLNILSTRIANEFKIAPLMYTGMQNDNDRETVKREFQNNPSYPVLLASEAGAEGLNLQVSNHLINFNLPDTSAIYTQRVGRIRRVGSAFDKVHIYNLMTEDSADIRKWEHIQQTKQLDDAFISIDEAQRQALKEAMKNA